MDLGGFTTDKRKAEYILAMHNFTFQKIINESEPDTEIPTGVFGSGKYVIIFNVARDLSKFSFGIINSNLPIGEFFDVFADTMSPKAVAGFQTIQNELKEKNLNNSLKTTLSVDDSKFEIAFRNYLALSGRQ